jgi:hypothetical protein
VHVQVTILAGEFLPVCQGCNRFAIEDVIV